MLPVTRRRTLQMGGSAIVAGLAGCGAFGRGSPPDPTLGDIEVTNLDFRSHTVSVLVLDAEEPVYWAEMDASAAEPEADDSSDVARAGGGSFEGFPTDVGEYVLYAWRDRQPASKWESFDFSEVDASCVGLDIQIGDVTESRAGEVSIWYTTNPNACEDVGDRGSD